MTPPAHPKSLDDLHHLRANIPVMFWGMTMNLLFKREQTDVAGKVKFKLWAQTELTEDEQHIVQRYRFDSAKVIDVLQPHLLRAAIGVGIAVALLAGVIFGYAMPWPLGWLLGAGAGIAAGYFVYDSQRQSLWVRDLLHGRHFSCDSVVELARKEAWIQMVVAFLRQVMESAKNWDGTETVPIDALTKQEAKYLVVKGL